MTEVENGFVDPPEDKKKNHASAEKQVTQLWKVLSSKSHMSRPMSDTPEDLWSRACQYFEWCDENPVVTKQTVMSGSMAGKKVQVEIPRPYSIKALMLHCGLSEAYIKNIRQTKNQESAYYIVISKILYLVYIQNYDYAMTGVFNSSFSSKVLGMGEEETEGQSAKIEIIHTEIPKLARSEEEVLENLEKEKSLSNLAKEQ